jgi:hypothetical protein
MTLPAFRRPPASSLRDSGVDHAAYERTVGALVHLLIGQLCSGIVDPSSITSLRSTRALAVMPH